jgi:hypothetical protein
MCFHGNTCIPLYEGGVKKADAICPGDSVITIDNTPGVIIGVIDDEKNAYKITTELGYSFIVSDDHIMQLINAKEDLVSIELSEFLLLEDKEKIKYRILVIPVLYENHPVDIDPYVFGKELRDEIPDIYMYNSVKNRVKLLNGIMDKMQNNKLRQHVDSIVLNKMKKTSFNPVLSRVITVSDNKLLKQIKWLCESIGYRYYCVGDQMNIIPNEEYIRQYRFSVKPVGVKKVYGFVLEGTDKRFLVDHYIVTNT